MVYIKPFSPRNERLSSYPDQQITPKCGDALVGIRLRLHSSSVEHADMNKRSDYNVRSKKSQGCETLIRDHMEGQRASARGIGEQLFETTVGQ
jgi:hypothetical protein